ncbi:MAG: M23 family metallopeptidase [Desulfobacterales bacterium]|nr:MAG: M23 family metallopeptidase [Desulfobacterales bacterium]
MKLRINTDLFVIATAFILSTALLLPWKVTAQNQVGQYPAVHASSNDVANGGILLLQIDTGARQLSDTDMRIDFNGHSHQVYRHPAGTNGVYFALIGIPYRTKTGPQKLTLNYFDATGKKSRLIPFQVVAGKYKTDVLKVDSRRVNPNNEDRQRASREHQEVRHVYASGVKERLWDGSFQLPVENEISSRFGNRRVFNGQLKSYHNGLDFRSPKGTPVYATNSGVVRLAKNLFYSGNAVIIDHGTEIFTIYAHLSKIETAAGRRIEKGQLIGLSGATGRVSGPHLHWGVKLNAVAVSPLRFVEVMDGLLQR